jgi:hypothetical protein
MNKYIGLAYPKLRNVKQIENPNVTSKDLNSEHELFPLSIFDIEENRRLITNCLPLCVEHREFDSVGHVDDMYIDANNSMMISGLINDRGKTLVDSGLNALSVHYIVNMSPCNKYVTGKVFVEISICEMPRIPGCYIKVSCSGGDDDDDNNNKNKNLTYQNIEKINMYQNDIF